MPGKSGRPLAKDGKGLENKQQIIDAAVRLIRDKGADSVTVRNVCREADVSNGTFYHYFRDKDDLLMSFLKEIPFGAAGLTIPVNDISGRIVELYMLLISRYMELGLDFMKSFYSTGNRSLSAYMGENDGRFEPGTVMHRSETEMAEALKQGIIKDGTDVHLVCMDICTIVKGCVFEWCLNNGAMDVERALRRIVAGYLKDYLASKHNRD